MAKKTKKEESGVEEMPVENVAASTTLKKFAYPIYSLVIEASSKAEADAKLAKMLAKNQQS